MTCEKCKGKGFLFAEDANGYLLAKKCSCLIEKENKEALERSGLTDFWRSRTFDTFIAKSPAQKRAKKACEKFNALGAVLCGQVGSGKTHLAVAMLLDQASNGLRVKFVNYRDFVRELSQNALDPAYYKKLMYQYKNTEVLLLDDLFKGTVTEAQRGFIYELINDRYNKNKKTIITTEKNINELMEIDEAIASRIIEMSEGFVVDMQGIENQRTKVMRK